MLRRVPMAWCLPGVCSLAGYAGSMNALIPVFPYPCAKFGKGQLGTDFGKADALRAVSAIGFAIVSLRVPNRES